MRNILPSTVAQSRSIMVAMVLGSAFTAGGSKATATEATKAAQFGQSIDPTPDAIRDITRYCQVCWRNARLPADRWQDCTQQVFTRLLERVEPTKWADLLRVDEGEERREFMRAIDAVKKRTQRARKFSELSPDLSDDRNFVDHARQDQREEVNRAAKEVLSPRQQRIVELCATGWAVPEIASELGTTPERVSDEKYKAIRKLRSHLGVDA